MGKNRRVAPFWAFVLELAERRGCAPDAVRPEADERWVEMDGAARAPYKLKAEELTQAKRDQGHSVDGR